MSRPYADHRELLFGSEIRPFENFIYRPGFYPPDFVERRVVVFCQLAFEQHYPLDIPFFGYQITADAINLPEAIEQIRLVFQSRRIEGLGVFYFHISFDQRGWRGVAVEREGEV